MKCPKCGYNSFEYLDSCKKCSNDLTSFKQTYGLKPLVLPAEVREELARSCRDGDASTGQQGDGAGQGDDMFSFDIPTNQAAPAVQNDDMFSFNDETLPEEKKEDDPFASLLESTTQSDDPFADLMPSSSQETVAAAPAKDEGLELGDFSWDETPEPVQQSAGAASVNTAGDDDFQSLFGDQEENKTV